jgi:hypothetical protein
MQLIGFARPLAREGFELIQSARGVQVYRRPSSGIIDLAAEGSFAASAEKVQSLLTNYEAHPGILSSVRESRVLHRQKDHIVVYQRLSMPMLDDRDYTLVVNWGRRGRTSWVFFGVDNRRGPVERPWMVRLFIHEGGWLLEPSAAGTRARYQVRLDLRGSLPRFLARSGAAREIPSMFEAFAKHIR